MRLHTLTMQAVGPFAGRYTVDFAALSAGGLFLLEGPTGAGKSTVIDAVVFALYGKVASAAASEDRLRSAFAGEDVETVVDLVFETGSGVYRVRRTPAFDRPKRRGTGTVRQQATVKLWRLTAAPEHPDDGEGELLSTRLDEAGAELTRVVGLDRAQFVQTMVLPQGEFAAFLRADPEQRRGLLQRIFGTEVYERVQHRLDELRRDAQRAVADARTRVQECAARFAGASGADEDGVAALREAAADDPAGVGPLVAERLDTLRTQAAEAQHVARTAADAAARAREAADAAGQRLRLVRRRRTLEAERARLAAAADQHAADLARLDRARRAAVVAPALRGADEARAVLAGAEKELHAALDTAPEGLAPADVVAALADPGLPRALTAVREAGAAAVATLRRVVALEDGLPRRTRDLDRLREVQAARARAMAEADELLAERPAARTALADALEAATDLAATAPARARDLEDAEAVLAAVRDLAAAGTPCARRPGCAPPGWTASPASSPPGWPTASRARSAAEPSTPSPRPCAPTTSARRTSPPPRRVAAPPRTPCATATRGWPRSPSGARRCASAPGVRTRRRPRTRWSAAGRRWPRRRPPGAPATGCGPTWRSTTGSPRSCGPPAPASATSTRRPCTSSPARSRTSTATARRSTPPATGTRRCSPGRARSRRGSTPRTPCSARSTGTRTPPAPRPSGPASSPAC
jgi:hypothetical protein